MTTVYVFYIVSKTDRSSDNTVYDRSDLEVSNNDMMLFVYNDNNTMTI